MFEVTFATTFHAMGQIFLLGFLGYMLVRRKFLDAKGLEVLSGLVIGVALPAFNFSQIIEHFNPQGFTNWWIFPLLGFAVVFGGIILASAVLVFRPKFKARKEFKALIGFQNSGYMPLMILSAFPQSPEVVGLTIYVILSLVGFDILLWSLGVWLMTGSETGKFDFRKLINPPMLATLLAVSLMFVGIGQKIPMTVFSPVKMLGNCLLPLVMLVLGGNFALTNLKNVRLADAASVVLTKLFLYPALMILFVGALGVSRMIGFFLVLEAAVPCANSLSVIARYYKTPNQDFINQSLFLTNLLSVITIPVFLMIYAKLI
ncbi:MAG: AEC family transporter [Candidatus Omnitrophica bacterium]|nr:AEC family transporter [Candidatus Omnitrophota bacterium]